MDLTAPSAVVPRAGSVPRGLAPAGVVLTGTLLSLFGASWDLEWHNDVGPDTFFTLSHLLMYAGSAVAGLGSLVVVLRTTARQRAGLPIDPVVGGGAVGVFGRTFSAPAGYLVAGCGAASFLLYGLWDQWWHGIYGFDAEIGSPPHVGLLLSISVTLTGALMIFASARRQTWGVVGTILAAGALFAFSMITAYATKELPTGAVNAFDVVTAFLAVVVVMTGSFVLDRRGAAFAVTAVVAVLQAILWPYSESATVWYARVEGLPMRDYLDPSPLHASMIPFVLLAVGAIIEAARGRAPAWLAGLVGGAIIGACAPAQSAWLAHQPLPGLTVVAATAAAAAAAGAVGGFLSLRFGTMLSRLAPGAGHPVSGSANGSTTPEVNHA
ncbi:hypothetical protein [Promicromonospora sp. NPDC050880]|uniref:hypothetical protein n=1 Tax=Promicromonospora sp. NPDC050880 TaxID=3364406 RepID=UPI003788DDD3